MKKTVGFIFVLLFTIKLSAQTTDTLTVALTDYAKDERFYKFQVSLALFLTQNDTILTYDYEGLKPAKPVTIKKPSGYMQYAYGFIFFTGANNHVNPGYLTVLVANPYNKNPWMFVDTDCDFDFTDEQKYLMPFYDEKPATIILKNAALPEGQIKIMLTRNKMYDKHDFKVYMDEYYASVYKGRKFIGTAFTYREQRLQARFGTVTFKDDSFNIALFDANSNAIYNDSDTDRLMVINTKDSIFDATNPLGTYTLVAKNKPMFFEKNGRYFELLRADPAGKYVTVKVSSDNPDLGNIKPGKKIPKLIFTLAEPNQKLKLKKLRKCQVYIYYANTSSRNFTADTLMLRQIAALDTNRLKVICVLYVNKSYYFKEFAHEAEANYFVALGTKEIVRKSGINSIPQSIWLNKRRRVIKYGVKPSKFIRTYLQYAEQKNKK